MRHLLKAGIFVFIVLLVLALPLSSSAPFTGKLVYVFELEGGENQTWTVYHGQQRSKVQMQGQGAAMVEMINDYENGVRTMVDHNSKMAIKLALEAPGAMTAHGKSAAHQGHKTHSDTEVPQKTGKMRVIHGYTCEQWLAEDENGVKTEVWNATGLGNILFGMNLDNPASGAGSVLGSYARLGFSEFCPFVLTRTNADGTVQSRIELREIVSETYPDSFFAPPADYQVQDLSALRGFSPPSGK